MLKTASELLLDIGGRIRARRLAMGWTQQGAARRAGVAHRTWQRMEGEGRASIEDVTKAAIALRCEEGLQALFPKPLMTSLDEILRQEVKDGAGGGLSRQRAPRGRPS